MYKTDYSIYLQYAGNSSISAVQYYCTYFIYYILRVAANAVNCFGLMGDNDKSELFAEAIAAAFVSSELTTFNSIQSFISSKIGRNLTKLERSSISKTLLKKSAHSRSLHNEEERGAPFSNNQSLESEKVFLVTSSIAQTLNLNID